MQTEYVLRDVASQHVSAPVRETTDEALIGLIADGDKRAMQVLYARHNVRVFRFIVRRTDEHLDDQMAAAIEDTADGPEAQVNTKDRNALVQKCLTQLSPAHREVIDLVYYHEKSVDEVARIVGVPAATVKTRMFYARNKMADLLKQAGVSAL